MCHAIPVPTEPLQPGHPERGCPCRRHECRCQVGCADRHLPGTHRLCGERRLRGLVQGAGKGDGEPGCHAFPRGMGLGLEGVVGCSPHPKTERCCLQIREVGWHDVAGWLGRGGSMLGTKR